MMKTVIIQTIIILTVILWSCKQKQVFNNQAFRQYLEEYIQYSDSCGYNHDFDYIIVMCTKESDTICFSFSQSRGGYSIIYFSREFIDFMEYDNHNIMLVGDYPNNVINFSKNKNLDLINDVLKTKFPEDFKKYSIDPHSVQPILNDRMGMVIKFYEGRMILYKRNYF